MKTLSTISSLILTLLMQTAWAQNPPGLKVDYVGYSGTGCPQGTVSATVAPDGSAVSFLFDRYAVQAQNSSASANCTVRFMLKPPRGYSLRVASVDYRGALVLGPGAQAEFRSTIIEQISRVVRTISNMSQTFQGPVNDLLNVTSGSNDVWWPCGGIAGMNFIFQSQINLHNPTPEEALVSVDSADTAVGATFNLAWEQCR